MALYSDEGIVLRTAKLGEADRIITLFTRGHGKVRAVAKGVRRTKSRFGARLEPFMRVSLLLAEGRSLDNVSQAKSIAAYAGAISGDYEAYRAASVICETLNDLVTTEHEPQPAQYQRVVGALRIVCVARARARRLDAAPARVCGVRAHRRAHVLLVCGRRDDVHGRPYAGSEAGERGRFAAAARAARR